MLTMEGANLVLGIRWLEMLRTNRTNHKELRMEFNQGEKIAILQGDPHLAETAILRATDDKKLTTSTTWYVNP